MVGNVPGSVIDEAMELDAGQLVRTLVVVPCGTTPHHMSSVLLYSIGCIAPAPTHSISSNRNTSKLAKSLTNPHSQLATTHNTTTQSGYHCTNNGVRRIIRCNSSSCRLREPEEHSKLQDISENLGFFSRGHHQIPLQTSPSHMWHIHLLPLALYQNAPGYHSTLPLVPSISGRRHR